MSCRDPAEHLAGHDAFEKRRAHADHCGRNTVLRMSATTRSPRRVTR